MPCSVVCPEVLPELADLGQPGGVLHLAVPFVGVFEHVKNRRELRLPDLDDPLPALQRMRMGPLCDRLANGSRKGVAIHTTILASSPAKYAST